MAEAKHSEGNGCAEYSIQSRLCVLVAEKKCPICQTLPEDDLLDHVILCSAQSMRRRCFAIDFRAEVVALSAVVESVARPAPLVDGVCACVRLVLLVFIMSLPDFDVKNYTLDVKLAADKKSLTLTLTHNMSKHVFNKLVSGDELEDLFEALTEAVGNSKFTLSKPAVADEVTFVCCLAFGFRVVCVHSFRFSRSIVCRNASIAFAPRFAAKFTTCSPSALKPIDSNASVYLSLLLFCVRFFFSALFCPLALFNRDIVWFVCSRRVGFAANGQHQERYVSVSYDACGLHGSLMLLLTELEQIQQQIRDEKKAHGLICVAVAVSVLLSLTMRVQTKRSAACIRNTVCILFSFCRSCVGC